MVSQRVHKYCTITHVRITRSMITLTAVSLAPNFPLECSCNFYKDFFVSEEFFEQKEYLHKRVLLFQSVSRCFSCLTLFPCSVSHYFFLSIPSLTLNQFSGLCFSAFKNVPLSPAFENPLTLNPLIFRWLPHLSKL